MPALKTLVSATPIRHPDDVARLRAILNNRGFDASDLDIQEVYTNWSERTWAAGWMGLGVYTDEQLLLILIRGMTERRGEPGPGATDG